MVVLDQRIDCSVAPIAPWQPHWSALARGRCTRMSQNVAFSPRREKLNVSSWDISATRKQPNPMTQMTRTDPHFAKCSFGSLAQPANFQAVTQIIERLSRRMRVTWEFSAASRSALGACSLVSVARIEPLEMCGTNLPRHSGVDAPPAICILSGNGRLVRTQSGD